VIALARYVAACCMNAQRWLAPGLIFLVVVAATNAAGEASAPNLSVDAVCLFPIAAWLTVATLNDEDASQLEISLAVAGGKVRLVGTKLAVAAGVAAALAAVSLIVTFVGDPGSLSAASLAAGALADALTIAGGVALGALCARPVISRTGTAVILIALVTLADALVPYAPPERLALDALSSHRRWPLLMVAIAATAFFVVLLLTAAAALGRRRS
jgi:hypothetical protein